MTVSPMNKLYGKAGEGRGGHRVRGLRIWDYIKNHWTIHFKWVNYIVYKLNLNKAVKKIFKRPKYQPKAMCGSYLDSDLNKPIQKDILRQSGKTEVRLPIKR